jgi:hypothetical protein
MTALTKINGSAPAEIAFFDLPREVRAVYGMAREVATAMQGCTADEIEHSIARIEAMVLTEERVEQLEAQITAGLRPADKATIGKQVTMMLGAFPMSSAPEPKIYAATMVQRINARRPSIIALASTWTKIVEGMKFAPAISEVLAILDVEQEEWPRRAWGLRGALEDFESERDRALQSLNNRLDRIFAESGDDPIPF